MSRGDNLTRWLVFSAAIGVTPIMLNFLMLYTQNDVVSWEDVVGRGELLIISAVIAGEAMSRLIGGPDRHDRLKKFKYLGGGACLVLLFLTAGWYASITSDISAGMVVEEGNITRGSLVLFLFTLVAGGSCVWLESLE